MRRLFLLSVCLFAIAVSGQGQHNSDSGNLAVIGAVSGSGRHLARLSDGVLPKNKVLKEAPRPPRLRNFGTHWVEYTWNEPVEFNKIGLYWHNFNGAVQVPGRYQIQYWTGERFAPVDDFHTQYGGNDNIERCTFNKVKTTRVRLAIDSVDDQITPLQEFIVYQLDGTHYAPLVKAGVDRDVMLNGKTYLSASVRSVGGPDGGDWSKISGPGTVRFSNASALVSTASFSVPGSYVLGFTAGRGADKAVSTLSVKVVAPPPAKRLDVVYTHPYKIDSKLWSDRIKVMIVNWIPWCIEECERTDLKKGAGGLDNFIEAAKALKGEPHEMQKGYVFANAWVYQTVESMCEALMVDPEGDQEIIAAQQKMRQTLKKWIPIILAAQEPDGYLQTAWTLRDTSKWHHRWSPAESRGNHEGYTAGYFIESAINHYMLTGGKDKRLYNAAKKLADCWVANIGPGKREWYDGHEEMEQALVRFGRFVNDMEGKSSHGDSYIRLAKFLLDCRHGGTEYDQSHLPVQRQYEAVGHAVRAVYLYSGMADVAAETGNVDYQSAVMSLWDNMVNKKYYVTGGVGSGETSEGFGGNYSLPNNAYCESCSSCGLIFFQYKMNLAYHDAKYADLYEETMYNALLGSLSLDGRDYIYTNPLSTAQARYGWHSCPCCVGNIPRTLLMLPTWTYLRGQDGLYVNLFIGSTMTVDKVAGTNVEMVQKTDYPWNGKVRITVNPKDSREFTIYVRVPNRTTSDLYTSFPEVNGLKSISVNGQSITPEIVNGYAVIRRTWKKGDRIDFELPMQVQKITADTKIAADQGMVALRYGPLIYNVEAADQDIKKTMGTGPLGVEWRPDFLHGVLVIKGKWSDGSALLAVPDYARMNRVKPTDYPESHKVLAPTLPNEPPRYIDGDPLSKVWIKTSVDMARIDAGK